MSPRHHRSFVDENLSQLGVYKSEQVELDSGDDYRSSYTVSGSETMSGKDKHKIFCKECGTLVWWECHERTMTIVSIAVLDE